LDDIIISATIETRSAMITAIRAPTSHAGTTAGTTIFSTVATGPMCSILATSYCRGCTAATPPAVCRTIGHSAAYVASATSAIRTGPKVSTAIGTSATAGIVRRKSTDAIE
jgi:hypothetical protein